jgi:hypothetical protein
MRRWAIAVSLVTGVVGLLPGGVRSYAQAPCPPGPGSPNVPYCPPVAPRVVMELAPPQVTVCNVTETVTDQNEPPRPKHPWFHKGKRHGREFREPAPVVASILVPAASGLASQDVRADRYTLMRAAFDLKYQEAVNAAIRRAEDEEKREALKHLEEVSKQMSAALTTPGEVNKQYQELSDRIAKLETLILEHDRFLREHYEKIRK